MDSNQNSLERKLLDFKWYDIIPVFGAFTNSMRNIGTLASNKSKHRLLKLGQYVPFLIYHKVAFDYTRPIVQEAINKINEYSQNLF